MFIKLLSDLNSKNAGMKKWFFIIFLSFPFLSSAQIISIFAGKDGIGILGDGGPATAAKISEPGVGVFDKYGNFYFASLGVKRVRKIDTLGIITTVAGGGSISADGIPATSAKLNSPYSVKLDTSGNLYICDGADNKIRKVNISSGIISTIAGNGIGGVGIDGIPATTSMLYDPQDICFDKFGNLYISEAFSYRVRKVNTAGIISTFAGTGVMGYSGENVPATDAQFDLPGGLVADDFGNVYIADPGSFSNRVRKVNTLGIISTVAGNGFAVYTGDGIPATNAQISPYFLALDTFNNLYVSDRYNERIYKIDLSGQIHNVAGNGIAGGNGNGGVATTAELYSPTGIALDVCGNLYICEVGTISIPDSFNNIRKITYNPTCDPYSHGHIDSASLQTKEPVGGKIAIYPNPAYSSLTISSTQKIKQVIIANFMGEEVYTGVYDIEKAEVNIAGLPEGVFVVRVTDDEGSVTMSKIVKQ